MRIAMAFLLFWSPGSASHKVIPNLEKKSPYCKAEILLTKRLFGSIITYLFTLYHPDIPLTNLGKFGHDWDPTKSITFKGFFSLITILFTETKKCMLHETIPIEAEVTKFSNVCCILLYLLKSLYLHNKNLRHWLIPSRDNDYQKIIQSVYNIKLCFLNWGKTLLFHS